MEDDAKGDIMTLLTADQLFTATVSPREEFGVGLYSSKTQGQSPSLFKLLQLTVTLKSKSYSCPIMHRCQWH